MRDADCSEHEGIVRKLCSRQFLCLHHQLERLNPVTHRGSDTRTGTQEMKIEGSRLENGRVQIPPGNSLELFSAGAFVMKRTNGGGMTNRADQYRRRAQQCLELAPTFQSHEARNILLHMAQVWLRLANNCEDANEMVGRSKAAEVARPVVQQQQQQIQPKDKHEE
jgi:hypothetical protein